MGIYINPIGTTKEDWLANNATPCTSNEVKRLSGDVLADDAGIFWADRGIFTLAAVVDRPSEYEQCYTLAGTGSVISSRWYKASKELLTEDILQIY